MYRLGAQEFTVSATQHVDRQMTRTHGCWVLRPEFTVNLRTGLTVNFSRQLDATHFTVRFTVKLE
jgi:hypothetical protein